MTTFTYVKIPANSDNPIEELTASKAGGLENDELVANAKTYFCAQAKGERPSCDIMALTIPLPGNNYHAVSLYASDYGVDSTVNERATQLVTACGHALPEPIRGDIFVGRAEDNEGGDGIWQRLDFTKADADPTAKWCRTARSSGGGGGQGGSASSLSGIVQKQLSNAQVVAPPSGSTLMYGMDGADAVKEDWGRWTQTGDEVEMKLTIPAGVKPQIQFKRNTLSISVNNETKVQGTLFGAVVPDECTYTMESVGSDQKELCVTLTKAEEGTTWSWLAVKK